MAGALRESMRRVSRLVLGWASRESSRQCGRDSGMVTAEIALATPSVILLCALGVGMMSVGMTQLRVAEAARVAAREVARGASSEQAVALARHLAGHVSASFDSDGDLTCLTLSHPISVAGLSVGQVHSRACVVPEQEAA